MLLKYGIDTFNTHWVFWCVHLNNCKGTLIISFWIKYQQYVLFELFSDIQTCSFCFLSLKIFKNSNISRLFDLFIVIKRKEDTAVTPCLTYSLPNSGLRCGIHSPWALQQGCFESHRIRGSALCWYTSNLYPLWTRMALWSGKLPPHEGK